MSPLVFEASGPKSSDDLQSAQYNRSLRLLLNSQDFPTERDLRQYEAGLTEAAAKQFDSSILLANMFQNEEIYPG